MRRLLAMTAAVFFAAVPMTAQAVTTATGTFTSDHCTGGCGPQAGGFGTITATDQGGGLIDISIVLLHGNTFANGGQDVSFGFNLLGNPTITYIGLPNTFSIPGVIPVNQQAAGALSADGFGVFEYGVDGTFAGQNGPSSLSFSISGAGLTLASFAQRSTIPPGDTEAFMVLDIFSGTTGFTGFVDLSGSGICPACTPFDVPGVPIPGAVWLFASGLGGLWALGRKRRKVAQLLEAQ